MIKMNKKGQVGIILIFFTVIAVILVVGLFIGIGVSTISMFMDDFVPEIAAIGTVAGANITEYSGYVLTPLTTFVNSWSWMGGMLYFISIIGLFGIAVAYRSTPNRWLIGFFVLFVVLIIFLSIFISNIYQDLYEDTSSFGDNIKEQKLLSFFMLHSPLILSIVAFASGIILFSGVGKEDAI